MSRQSLIARSVALVAVAVAVVVVLSLSGSSSYVLRLTMANASGLRPGSQVLVGGVPIGSVGDLNMSDAGDAVIADLDIDKGTVRVGRGVRAQVIASNLLGSKAVQLYPGDRNQPLPSGTTLPESRTSVPTDLDQVVDVLNQPTRADLAMMLTEAGEAVAGRKADVSGILRQLPLSLNAATKLLQGMVTDNHTLGDFIANSNAFIARVDAREPQLKALLNSFAGASQTFADKAGALAQIVQRGPEFFSRVKTYFADITTGANHLNPVAATLTQAAGPLDATLKEIKPFAAAAVPTLNRAAQVAPTLGDLAVHATPTLNEAVPTVQSLAKVAQLSGPLSTWLGLSSQDLFNIFDGWSHAIQYRDGVSHIFNGDLYLNPEIVLRSADAGATPQQKAQNLLDLAPAIVRQLGLAGAVAKAKAFLAGLTHTSSPTPAKVPAAPAPAASHSSSTGPGNGGSGPGSSGGGATGGGSGLLGALGSGLNHLLGGALGPKTGATGASGTTGASKNPGGGNPVGGALSGLLSYLLGR